MVEQMMNAYELAKKLDWYTNYPEFVEAANMLCQQADKLNKYELRNQEQIKRIAELENENSNLKYEISSNAWGKSGQSIPCNTKPQTKPLTEEDAPFQKVAPKEVADAIDAALSLKQSEPVAWMYQIHDITGWTWVFSQRLPDYKYRNPKPLYTTPHHASDVKQTKPLSDEEIMDFVDAFSLDMGNVYEFYPENILKMIRAIEAKVRGES